MSSSRQVAWFDAHTHAVTVLDQSTSLAEAPASLNLGYARDGYTVRADDLIYAAGWRRDSRWHAVAEEDGLYWAWVS